MKPQTFRKSLVVPTHSSHSGLALIQQMFGDAAFSHAELLGYGDQEMKDQNLMWVVSRMVVDITTLPKPGEIVMIETWPSPHHLLGVTRQYVMTDEFDQPLCRGEALWCIIDRVSGRLIKTQGLPLLADDSWLRTDKASSFVQTGRIVKPQDRIGRQITVAPILADIDKNDHVNNVVYTDWIFQNITPKKPRFYRINYLQQVRLGDTITMDILESTTKVVVSGVIVTPDSDIPAFIASIEYEEE